MNFYFTDIVSDHIVADVDAGKNLESIVDSNNKYSYTYNETGIRTSKTVNGKTTYYNTKDGVILSQINGTDTLYFQYDNTVLLSILFGMVHNIYINIKPMHIHFIYEAKHESININTISLCNY